MPVQSTWSTYVNYTKYTKYNNKNYINYVKYKREHQNIVTNEHFSSKVCQDRDKIVRSVAITVLVSQCRVAPKQTKASPWKIN